MERINLNISNNEISPRVERKPVVVYEDVMRSKSQMLKESKGKIAVYL